MGADGQTVSVSELTLMYGLDLGQPPGASASKPRAAAADGPPESTPRRMLPPALVPRREAAVDPE